MATTLEKSKHDCKKKNKLKMIEDSVIRKLCIYLYKKFNLILKNFFFNLINNFNLKLFLK